MWLLVLAGVILGIPLLFKTVGVLGGLLGRLIGAVMVTVANLTETLVRKAPPASAIILIGAAGLGGVYILTPESMWAIEGHARDLLTGLTLLETSAAKSWLGSEVFGVVSIRYVLACGIGVVAAHLLRRAGEKSIAALRNVEWSV